VRVNGRLREHRESYTSSIWFALLDDLGHRSLRDAFIVLCAGSGAVATEYHEDPMFDLDAS
jgi:hypothetical protein